MSKGYRTAKRALGHLLFGIIIFWAAVLLIAFLYIALQPIMR
jgi:hypothetical protein